MHSTQQRLPDAAQVKLCPNCGRSERADRIRCSACWSDVTQAPVLTPEQTERQLALEQAERTRRAEAERRQQQQVRLIRAVAVVALLGVVAWWAYEAFVVQPPELPPPVSAERQLLTTPEAWATAGGDLGSRRATTASVALDVEPRVLDLGASPAVPLVADRGTVYAALVDGRVVAIDTQDGTERWVLSLQNPPFAAPVLAGDRLYVPLRQGVILAVDVESGEVAWESEGTPSVFLASPVVADGIVYAFGTRSVHGFDAETGETLWSAEVDRNTSQVGPVVAGGYVAVATTPRVQVFDRTTGEQTYFFEFFRTQATALMSAEGVIYPVYGRFAAAFPNDARRPWWDRFRVVWAQLWAWGMAREVPPPPSFWTEQGTPREAFPAVLAEDHVIVAGHHGELMALDRWTGAETWRTNDRPATGAPILAAEGLLLPQGDRLTLIDVERGELLAERVIDELANGEELRSLAVTSEGLFLVTNHGRLIVLR